MSGNKIKKTWCFSPDLCEKIKGYALMENKSETQFVTDCINDHIGRETSTDNLLLGAFESLRREVERNTTQLKLSTAKDDAFRRWLYPFVASEFARIKGKKADSLTVAEIIDVINRLKPMENSFEIFCRRKLPEYVNSIKRQLVDYSIQEEKEDDSDQSEFS